MNRFGSFFLDQRMGMELAATSGLGIALAVTMIVCQLRSDARVAVANE